MGLKQKLVRAAKSLYLLLGSVTWNAEIVRMAKGLSLLYDGLPRPVVRDRKHEDSVDKWSKRTHARKVIEELREAMHAKTKEEQAEELTDIITVCTTWLEALGYGLV